MLLRRFLNMRLANGSLQTDEFNSRYDTLNLELKKKSSNALLFNVIFMIRRFVFAFLLISLDNMPWAQIPLLVLVNLFTMIYQCWAKPFMMSLRNMHEIANEGIILVLTYFLLTYTEFLNDPSDRYLVGWLNIVLFMLFVVYNASVVVGKQIYFLHRNLKLRAIKSSYMKYQA